MRTIYTQSKVVKALAYAVRTANAAVNGSAIDLAQGGNNYRDALFIFKTETVTDGTVAVTVEESDASGSGYAAVDSTRIQGTLPAVTVDDDDTVYAIGVRPTKRYIRLVATTAGATSGAGFSAVAVLGNGSNNPPV